MYKMLNSGDSVFFCFSVEENTINGSIPLSDTIRIVPPILTLQDFHNETVRIAEHFGKPTDGTNIAVWIGYCAIMTCKCYVNGIWAMSDTPSNALQSMFDKLSGKKEDILITDDLSGVE